MKKFCKELVWGLLYICALCVPHKPRGTILLYHSISDTKDFFAVSPDVFKKQMEYLKEKNATISLDAMMSFITGSPLTQNSVSITFDDGYKDFAYTALPILKELEIPATIFVLGGPVDRNALGNEEELLAETDVQILNDPLVTIGSHGQTHRKLTKISPPEASEEIRESRIQIKTTYGITPEYLAYPKGSWNPDVAEIVRDAGYKGAFTVIETSVPQKVNAYAIPRIQVDGSTSFLQFKAKLTPAADWYYWLWCVFRK